MQGYDIGINKTISSNKYIIISNNNYNSYYLLQFHTTNIKQYIQPFKLFL